MHLTAIRIVSSKYGLMVTMHASHSKWQFVVRQQLRFSAWPEDAKAKLWFPTSSSYKNFSLLGKQRVSSISFLANPLLCASVYLTRQVWIQVLSYHVFVLSGKIQARTPDISAYPLSSKWPWAVTEFWCAPINSFKIFKIHWQQHCYWNNSLKRRWNPAKCISCFILNMLTFSKRCLTCCSLFLGFLYNVVPMGI